jgi:ADP-heptose:LPS heptosyltransferase
MPPAPVLPPSRPVFVLVGMLGDTIMCLPVLESARKLWPQARISAIVTPRIREMLSGLSYIDELLIGTADPLSIRGKEEAEATQAMIESKGFDAAFMLGGDQYAALFYRAGVPIRVGPAPCVYSPLYTHGYPIDDGKTWGPNERLSALQSLGVQAPPLIPRLEISAEMVSAFREKQEVLGLRLEEDFVVLHPFGSTERQRWPLDRVNSLAERIQSATGLRSLLVGGPEFKETVASLPAHPTLINAVGAFSISELLGAIDSAEYVITTDSGPFHMAGALGRPILGLFRGSRPQHASRYPDAKVLFGAHSICEKRCEWNRCDASPCRQLESISVDQLMIAFEEIVNSYGMKR